MTLDERDRLLGNWRGRRLLTCRAVDDLFKVVESLGLDDGSLPPSDNRNQNPTDAQRNELENAVTLVLRMILVANDGIISKSKLQKF